MKIFQKLLLASSLFASLQMQAREIQVKSPNGQIAVTLSDDAGLLNYQVNLDQYTFILPSRLGLKMDLGDYTDQLALTEEYQVKKVTDHYELQTIKCSRVDYEANELTATCTQHGNKVFDIVFRVSNRDVAYCYRVYPQGDKNSGVITSEASSFKFPSNTTTFLCPQAEPMHGFAGTSPSYETSYTMDDQLGKNGWGQGYTFPCLFREGNAGWVLVSETGVDANYVGSRLMGHKDGTYSIGFPQAAEMNGQGSTSVAIALPGNTPWRTLTLGKTLAPIVETTVPYDLVQPKYEASQPYIYGAGTWSWIIQMDGYTRYDEQKRYIDFAAAMGYKSVLIDALWDTQIGRDKIAELARYGAAKGVGIYLWYNSNGAWNYAPQGPRGIMNNTIARKKEMKWMHQIGIRGIKVDFFGGDKQPMMKLYEDILSDANDYGLMVIFHGCTLPRGWERMYPNYVASEAVLASENLHFGQGACDAEAFNACIHPFIRNTVGSMDFGGSTLNKHYSRDNQKGTTRRTSDVYALATAVLFQSSVQHFAMAPNNLEDAPAWAIDFMKKVPTTWDEVKFIDGYPGKYVILARRHGNTWYIAGVNANKTPVRLTLHLPMLQAGQATLYADKWTKKVTDILSENLGNVSQVKVGKKGTLTIEMKQNCGFVLVQ